MSPSRSQRPAGVHLPWRAVSLENAIALGLCLAVVLGSAAVIETDRRISSALLNRGVDRPAQEGTALGGVRSLELRTSPDLICVICIGGLRSDHIPLEAGTATINTLSPELQRFAAESVGFETVCAQASYPLISIKSMLTGNYPSSLILRNTSKDQFSLTGLEAPREFLRETFNAVASTLAPGLGAAGYRTGLITDSRWGLEEAGLARDFDDSERVDRGSSRGQPVLRHGLDWLRANDGSRMFLFLHLEDLLGPVSGELARARASYNRRLSAVDTGLGRFFSALRSDGLWDRALIVLTSDHGTSLGERGAVGHGDLYLEQLRVPLLFKFPADWHVAPAHIKEPAELIDLFPTILAICERRGSELDGVSLLPIIQRGVHGRRILVAQTRMRGDGANAAARTVLKPGHWQVIHAADNERLEFFALEPDPAALRSVHPGDMNLPPFISELFPVEEEDHHHAAALEPLGSQR